MKRRKIYAVTVRDFFTRLDKVFGKCYTKNRSCSIASEARIFLKQKGENGMKWIILGVIFGVVAVIRGNGIAFS